MLSAEERRRLEEIERALRTYDPDFVARMRSGRRRPRRWAAVMLHGLLWIAVITIGVTAGWVAGAAAAAIGGLITAIAGYRRRRSDRAAGHPRRR